VKVIIKARQLWNHTGIEVVAGREYAFSAHGVWIDCYIRNGPEDGRDESDQGCLCLCGEETTRD
jgi:hypothetical protein